MKWVKVLLEKELPEGERHTIKVEGHTVLLIHHQGAIYAVLAACPHLGLPLKRGKITDDHALVCPFHHSAFDLASGDVKDWAPWPPVMGRMLGSLSREKVLRVFPTRVQEDAIWIGLAESEGTSEEMTI